MLDGSKEKDQHPEMNQEDYFINLKRGDESQGQHGKRKLISEIFKKEST